MKGKEYLHVQATIIQVGKSVQGLDLDNFLRCISNAKSVAPILDPTLFRKAQANLEAIEKLAMAVKQVQETFEVVQQAVIGTVAAGFMQPKPDMSDA